MAGPHAATRQGVRLLPIRSADHAESTTPTRGCQGAAVRSLERVPFGRIDSRFERILVIVVFDHTAQFQPRLEVFVAGRLQHGHDLAALGDGDRLTGVVNLIDQLEAARLEFTGRYGSLHVTSLSDWSDSHKPLRSSFPRPC